MNRINCVMRLRLCASAQTIARMEAVWKVFWLPTQASRTKPWPRAAYPIARRSPSPSATRPWTSATGGHRYAPSMAFRRPQAALNGPMRATGHRVPRAACPNFDPAPPFTPPRAVLPLVLLPAGASSGPPAALAADSGTTLPVATGATLGIR